MNWWKGLELRWKAMIAAAVLLVPASTAWISYFDDAIYWYSVQEGAGGLMNFVDAKQQGVIRFLGSNEKLAKQLGTLVEEAKPEAVQKYFAAIVKTDVFDVEEHPFKDEIKAGKRKISTFQVYRSIDFIRNGTIEISSEPTRVGHKVENEPDMSNGYSDVHRHDGVAQLAFSAPAAGGEVIVHADAGMLTNIVNGEIGNLEGDMGAFYLAGVGKTFDYYITNKENVLMTESRVRPGQLLQGKGSEFPWQRTQTGAQDPACKGGVYATNAKLTTGCGEAMGFYDGVDGKRVLGASMPFYDSGWTITVEQQTDELLGPLHSLRLQLVASAALGLVLLLCLTFFILQRTLRRASQVSTMANAIAEGDLTVSELETGSNDELGRVARACNAMLHKLHGLLGGISDNAASVVTIAGQISAHNGSVNQGAERQRQEIDHVATAMNQMTSTVQEVARHAEEAAAAARDASSEAIAGNDVAAETMATIGNLADEVEKASRVIHRLEEGSRDIGGILDVIRGIAEQTNLLALNAAIEAARAGEQGRGFAVVADEVRTLASRTQQSTQEIQEMIEKLQTGAGEAVTVMDAGQKQAEESVKRAGEARASLERISGAVATINEMNTQIATASEEQSSVSEEINRNVVAISQVAEENAETVRQADASSEALAQLAGELNGMIEQFKL